MNPLRLLALLPALTLAACVSPKRAVTTDVAPTAQFEAVKFSKLPGWRIG